MRVSGEFDATVESRVLAYAKRLRHGNVFGYVTAAVLWGVPLPLDVDDSKLHVVAPIPRRAPAGAGVAGHRSQLLTHEIGWLGELPVTSAARTWCDLAEVLSIDDLIAAGEWLLTGNPYARVLPKATIEELTSASRSRTGSRGSPARARALPLMREGALSRPETLLRLLLERAGIPSALINSEVFDDRGSFLAMPDLCWPSYKVAVEYEGKHHAGTQQFRKDIRRIERLVDHGWLVVKISAIDLFDEPQEAVARVGRRLASRGWHGRAELRPSAAYSR